MAERQIQKKTIDEMLHEMSDSKSLVTLYGKQGRAYIYSLEERALGEGGFAKVIPAIRRDDHRRVAIKIFAIHHEHYDPKRIQREADVFSILAQNGEERIVRMLDVILMPQHLRIDGDDQRIFALVFELLEGVKLTEYMFEDHQLSETLGIFGELVGATKSLHDEGIVHRDLKPDNVIRTEGGGIVVVDLGAAFVKRLPKLTQVKMVNTTPGYMASEWIEGNDHVREPSADIFSLYVILFEMLAGGKRYRFGNHFISIVKLALSDKGFGEKQRDRLPENLKNHAAWPMIDALLIAMSNHDKDLRPNIDEVQSRLNEIVRVVNRDDMILPSQRRPSPFSAEQTAEEIADPAKATVKVSVSEPLREFSAAASEDNASERDTPLLPVMPTSLREFAGIQVGGMADESSVSDVPSESGQLMQRDSVLERGAEESSDMSTTSEKQRLPFFYASPVVVVIALLGWAIAGGAIMRLCMLH